MSESQVNQNAQSAASAASCINQSEGADFRGLSASADLDPERTPLGSTVPRDRIHSTGRMEVSDSTPAALVERIRAGERSAEQELVERYSRGIAFVIRQLVSDRDAAGDIYQETFRLVLEKIRLGTVREPGRLSGFIASIARNLVIEQFRGVSRRRAREEPEAGQPIASPAPSPLEGLLREEKSSLVRRVLASLPSDRDRKILYRFYLADDDKDEICADLGVTNLHFNQILCRARERYRKLFEEMTMQPKKKTHQGWNSCLGRRTYIDSRSQAHGTLFYRRAQPD
jgi:RNA polymerase sigma-70 factor (ECF subfamily)